jgi:hypothetical protein
MSVIGEYGSQTQRPLQLNDEFSHLGSPLPSEKLGNRSTSNNFRGLQIDRLLPRWLLFSTSAERARLRLPGAGVTSHVRGRFLKREREARRAGRGEGEPSSTSRREYPLTRPERRLRRERPVQEAA